MTARKAYPSTRKAKRPRMRRKKPISRQKRQFKQNIKKMAELKEHADTGFSIWELANQKDPVFPPTTDGRQFRRNACNVLVPGAFTYMPDELMDGQAIFAKYLQMKLRITFPSGPDILVPDQTLYLIHGYCDPMKLTADDFDLTMSNGREVKTVPENLIDKSYIPWYIMDKLHEEFNDENDQMAWLPKSKRRGYSILGYNKITVDKDSAITSRTHLGAVTPGVGVQEGGPPQILRRITWPMNRKVQYTYSKPSELLEGFYYPNDNAVPFVCLFNPQWNKQGFDDRPNAGIGTIKVEAASKLWYNDF